MPLRNLVNGSLFLIQSRTIYSKLANIKDFRGITLSPVLSKIFEHCLLLLFQDFLVSSEFQFGFKKGKGCRDALLIASMKLLIILLQIVQPFACVPLSADKSFR